MDNGSHQGRVHIEFPGSGDDFIPVRGQEQRGFMPVHLGTGVAGVAMETDNLHLGVTGALAAIGHHAVLVGVAIHGFGFGGGPGLSFALHIGELHPAIRMHNALDAVGIGGACHQK